MTSWPFVRRTFATLRNAEFGFLGVRVITCTHTPRRCGHFTSAGDFDLTVALRRPARTSWLIVGIGYLKMSGSEGFGGQKQHQRCSFTPSPTRRGRGNRREEDRIGKRKAEEFGGSGLGYSAY